MKELLEIQLGERYYLRFPLTKKGIKIAQELLDLAKEELQQKV